MSLMTKFCNLILKKDDLRVEIVGCIDELNSLIGYIISSVKDKELKKELKEIQKDLYVVSSDIAGGRLKVKKEQINKIVEKSKKIKERIPKINKFLIPGGTIASSILHVARAICRRCERRAVHATKKHKINKNVLIYLNELSNLFYLMAREQNIKNKVKEEFL